MLLTYYRRLISIRFYLNIYKIALNCKEIYLTRTENENEMGELREGKRKPSYTPMHNTKGYKRRCIPVPPSPSLASLVYRSCDLAERHYPILTNRVIVGLEAPNTVKRGRRYLR